MYNPLMKKTLVIVLSVVAILAVIFIKPESVTVHATAAPPPDLCVNVTGSCNSVLLCDDLLSNKAVRCDGAIYHTCVGLVYPCNTVFGSLKMKWFYVFLTSVVVAEALIIMMFARRQSSQVLSKRQAWASLPINIFIYSTLTLLLIIASQEATDSPMRFFANLWQIGLVTISGVAILKALAYSAIFKKRIKDMLLISLAATCVSFIVGAITIYILSK